MLAYIYSDNSFFTHFYDKKKHIFMIKKKLHLVEYTQILNTPEKLNLRTILFSQIYLTFNKRFTK